ncbi:MAG: YDG domain-containing protein, partial [Methylococcales bacterium]|nr:YDG domain-containing protein [Methylococcales bacterium]
AANFDTKNVGSAKTVTLSNIAITGADAPNYTISNLPTTTRADITARTLTLAAQAETKIYDGNTLATPRFTDDRIVGDALQIDGTANFDTKNVGTAKTVSLSNVAITGADAPNYTISNLPTTTRADITARTLTLTAQAETKIYDGNTLAKPSFTDDRIVGDVLKIDGTANFETKNVGAAKTVNLSNVAITGTDALNYAVNTLPTMTTADITPAPLTISVEPKTKTYGDVDPSFTYKADAFRGNDNNSLLVGSLARSDKSENVGKYLISGKFSAGENYLVNLIPNNLDITSASLIVTANGKTKLVGTIDPVFDFVAQGLKLKDVADVVITGSLLRDMGENVGSYSINQGSLTANSNYLLSYKAGTLEINNNDTNTTTGGTVVTSTPSSLNTDAVEQTIKAVFKDATPQQIQTVTTSVATNVNSQTNTILTMPIATPTMTTVTSGASNIIASKAETTSSSSEGESSSSSSSGTEKSTLASGSSSPKDVKESKDEKNEKKDKKADVAIVTTITDTKSARPLQQCK